MPLVHRSGSRALRIGVLTASLAAVAVLLGPGAAAQSATDTSGTSAAALRTQADDLANRYFAALSRVQTLDKDIARNEQAVADLTTRAKKVRHNTRARAVVAYTTSGSQLSALMDGQDALDTARRVRLIDRVVAHDETVFTKLRVATRALHKRQRILRDTRQAQADALNELRDQGAAINAKLAQAELEEQSARTAAVVAAIGPPATTTTGTAPQDSAAPQDTVAPASSTTTTTAAPPATPSPPPNYVGTPGVNPHHDDPFLTCVRQRESGGNYGAVNAAGPWLGAYQFLQSTWNLTASHAGNTDLVGVPANTASPYDQDDMAWALYQWQGMGPWGGSCP